MSDFLLQTAARRDLPVPVSPDAAALGELACSVMLRPRRGVRRMPRELDYLESAQRFTLPSPVGALAAWAWGPEAGPLVGLVHGWEGHGAQLGAFVAPLVAAGFRVVTFDAPGHGDSPGDEASVPQLGRLLVGLEAALGPFFALVGHSMGAAASAMALAYGARPRGLVLLAPPGSMRARVERIAARFKLAGEAREAFFGAVERRTQAGYAETDLRAVARAAGCPALVFHDPADEDTSFAEAEAVVAVWPGGRMVPCPGRGHYRLIFTPEVVRETAAFITGLRPGPAAAV